MLRRAVLALPGMVPDDYNLRAAFYSEEKYTGPDEADQHCGEHLPR